MRYDGVVWVKSLLFIIRDPVVFSHVRWVGEVLQGRDATAVGVWSRVLL